MEALWIGIAFALGLLVRQLGLPPLVGFLGAGFVLSAGGYKSIAALEHLAHLGILLLLFSVGLKLRFRSVLTKEVFGGSLAHLTISIALFLPAIAALTGIYDTPTIIIGIALALSSTVVAAKILEEKKELRAFHGRVAIGILIVQDLVAVATLSFLSGSTPSGYALLLLGLPLLRPLLFKLLELSGHDELLILFGLGMALVLGGVTFELVGLSAELGALVAGALLAEHKRSKELSDALWGLKEVFLVGYFLQIGLSGLPSWGGLGFALALALLLPLKAILFFFILLRFRLRARSCFLTGLSLASFSEFGLIVAHMGSRNGFLDPEWLVLFAITVAISFVLVAPLNHHAHNIYQRLEPFLSRFETKSRHPDDEPISLGSAHLVVMGMGRVGTGAYDFLTLRHKRVVGLDSDPGKVERHRREGRRVLYADAEDPGFWHRLKVDGIEAILLAMPDVESKQLAATELRRKGYSGFIGATSKFAEESKSIELAGCDLSFNYYGEVGVGFAEHVWEAMNPDSLPD